MVGLPRDRTNGIEQPLHRIQIAFQRLSATCCQLIRCFRPPTDERLVPGTEVALVVSGMISKRTPPLAGRRTTASCWGWAERSAVAV